MLYSKVKAYKYKLEAPEMRDTDFRGYEFDTKYMSMLDDGQLLVKYGYAWDGSSVPHKGKIRALSFLNPLVWIRIKDAYDADKYCKTASLIHDALCQAIREEWMQIVSKILADILYRDMCFECRMAAWNATYKAKSKKKIEKKRKRYEKKVKRWANRRYYALRKFGDRGIEPEKHPRNKVYEVK